MRAPRRKRPRHREIDIPREVDLEALARPVRYVGSPEHKDAPSFAGQPRPRADATICDRSLIHKQRELTRWLRKAIRLGNVGAPWEGRFPRYVWYRDGDTLYEARLVNRGRGEYKGYALSLDEWPKGIRS
jgi:hypothetical protein